MSAWLALAQDQDFVLVLPSGKKVDSSEVEPENALRLRSNRLGQTNVIDVVLNDPSEVNRCSCCVACRIPPDHEHNGQR